MRIVKYLFVLFFMTGFARAELDQATDYEKYAYDSDYYRACEKSALDTRAGRLVKVEFKIEDDQPVYEFDIRAADGRDRDVECHAGKNKIIEIEEEVPSVNHPLFANKKRIDEKQARETVLDVWAGDILEIEYEIESDGEASYEFDIHTYKGVEMKVEVNATTGEIVEQSVELWQEGYE